MARLPRRGGGEREGMSKIVACSDADRQCPPQLVSRAYSYFMSLCCWGEPDAFAILQRARPAQYQFWGSPRYCEQYGGWLWRKCSHPTCHRRPSSGHILALPQQFLAFPAPFPLFPLIAVAKTSVVAGKERVFRDRCTREHPAASHRGVEESANVFSM